jgi:hypothetical protein
MWLLAHRLVRGLDLSTMVEILDGRPDAQSDNFSIPGRVSIPSHSAYHSQGIR